MSFEFTIDTNAAEVIRQLSRRTDRAGKAAEKAMVKTLQLRAEKILQRAKEKTPVLFRHLQSSGQKTSTSDGATITFGGLGAQYAEIQHENKSFVHSGPRAGKYVYSGATHKGTKVGDENAPRAGGTKTWHYKSVKYDKRHLASKFNPKVGQSHFLFGASNSAFEELWPRSLLEIAHAGVKAAQKAIDNAPRTA